MAMNAIPPCNITDNHFTRLPSTATSCRWWTSGQASHWLIESPTNLSSVYSRPYKIFVNLIKFNASVKHDIMNKDETQLGTVLRFEMATFTF